jgi:CHAT domain-containing protein/tetratricopeptide (TPR) repeat protein
MFRLCEAAKLHQYLSISFSSSLLSLDCYKLGTLHHRLDPRQLKACRMLSSRFFSRVFTHGLMPVLAGCLALPLEVNGQADPTAQVPAQKASAQPSSVQLPAAAQAKLEELEEALQAAHASGDAKSEAATLNQIGKLFFRASNFPKALESYSAALTPAHTEHDVRQETAALNGTADCLRSQGQNQKALAAYQQALDLATFSGDEDGQASALNGIGWVDNILGKYQESLQFHNRALPLARKAGDDELEATILRRIGNSYYALGDRQKSLEYQKQALPISVKIGDRPGEGRALGNMGVIYEALGDKQKALEYNEQAVPILHETGDLGAEGNALNSIGMAYSDLGQPEKALIYFQRALPIVHQSGSPEFEALVLSNTGLVCSSVGEQRFALLFLGRALVIWRASGNRRGEARTLSNIGWVNSRLGEQQKALDNYSQALAIIREIGDRDAEAASLGAIAITYDELGDIQKAFDFLNQALPLAAATGDPVMEAGIFAELMRNQKSQQPALAVFYGKQSVNLLQQVRSNIKGLDKELQASFLASQGERYHNLADLLISQGRLPEAQQVLDLLKQQEYQDYVRGETANTLSPLTLTPAENQAEADYQKSTAQLVSVAEQWAQLKKNTARTPEQEELYRRLNDQIKAANKELEEYIARLYVLFGKNDDANNHVANVTGGVSVLQRTIVKTPHTVALYTLVGSDRIRIIVVTGSATVAREFAISQSDLNKKVEDFAQVLRNKAQDPKPLAQELYAALIAPVKPDLDQAGAQTLIWSLDGVLRYVPIAALYDGKQYVLEKYNTVTITPASLGSLNEKPDVRAMSTLAMGISQKYEEGLPALPGVEAELNHVVNDPKVQGANGVMPGTILLNGRFTEKGMVNLLGGQHSVIHIASHFVFLPGDDEKSYLLLAGEGGAAFHLTVAEFHTNPQLDLGETDLLTLSACETGVSGNAGNGREVDGLGMTAQIKGAKAVISSLWAVNDASTGQLMADFYKRWVDGAGNVTKVEALRQAQLDLLLGPLNAATGTRDRGSAPEKADSETPALASYAHPYYWAPFVLMGNWR